MKKILGLFIAVVMAYGLNAITINWTASNSSSLTSFNATSSAMVYASDSTSSGTLADIAAVANGETVAGFTKDPTLNPATVVESDFSGVNSADVSVAPQHDAYLVFFFDRKPGSYAILHIPEGEGYWFTTGPNQQDKIFEGVFEGTAVAVPEPTALALLALGIAGLALRRRA